MSSSGEFVSPWSGAKDGQLAIAEQLSFNAFVDTKPGEVNYFEKFAETRAKSNELYTDLLVEADFERARKQLEKRTSLLKVKIKERVSKDEQPQLCKDFYMFDLDFTEARDTSGHAYYRCHRRLSVLYMKWKAKINRTSKPANGYDVVWKDVGGNPITHLNLNDYHCHTCCPLIDQNDDIRHSNFKEKLRRMEVTGPLSNLYKDYVDRKSRVICVRKAQFCSISAEVLFFIHSSYDITLEEIATSMARARAFVGYGCFHFHPSIVFNDSGILSHGLCYQKYVKYGKIRIRFWFENDVQNGYDHDWCNYIALVKANRISCKINGVVHYYSVQIQEMMSNVVYFKISRCENGSVPKSSPFRVLTNELFDEKLVIYHYQWKTLVESKFESFESDHMQLQRLVVPRRLYERGYSYASNLPETRFTFQNIEVALTSFNTREIISGQVVSIDPIPAKEVKSLARVIYVQVFIDNYENSKTVKLLLEDEKRVRDDVSKSFMARWFSNGYKKSKHRFKDLHVATSPAHVDEEKTGFFAGIIRRILKNAEVVRRFETYISDKFVKFLTFEEELDMLLLDEEQNDRGFSSESFINYGDFQKVKELISEPLSVEKDPSLNLTIKDLVSEFCLTDLKTVKNSSNGNCVMQSIIDSGLWDKDIVSLRRFLKSSRQIHQLAKRDELIAELSVEDGSSEGHCSMDIYILVAMVFQVRVCVHRFESQYQFGTGKLYHFCLEDKHAQALLPHVKLDDPVCFDVDEIYSPERNFRDNLSRVTVGMSKSEAEKVFPIVKRSMFHLSELGKCGFEFVKAIEMAELDSRFTFTGEFCFVYGPLSGYVEYLLDRSWKVTNSSDSKRLGVVPRFMNPNYTYVYGEHLTGDLDTSSHVLSVAQEALQLFVKGYDLFVGCSSRCSIRKPMDGEVFRNEKALMNVVLREHGDALFRISPDCDLISLSQVFEEFETVTILRLEVVNPIDPVFFVVCRGYKGIVSVSDTVNINLREFLNNSMNNAVKTFDSINSMHRSGSSLRVSCDEETLECYRNAFCLNAQSKFGVSLVEKVLPRAPSKVVHTRESLRARMSEKSSMSFSPVDSDLELEEDFSSDFQSLMLKEDVEVIEKLEKKSTRSRTKKLKGLFKKKKIPVLPHSDGLTVLGQSRPTGISLPVYSVDNVYLPLESPPVQPDDVENVPSSSSVSPSSAPVSALVSSPSVTGSVSALPSSLEQASIVARAAMREYLALCRYELFVEISNHQRVFDKLAKCLPLKTVVRNEVGGYGIAIHDGNCAYTFEVKPDTDITSWNKFYYKGAFHKMDDLGRIVTIGDRFIVSDFSSVCLQNEVLDSLEKFDINRFVLPESLSIVQAAPGCGKTTFIVKNCNPWTSPDPSTVILSTIEGKNDFIDRVSARVGETCDKENAKYYRTMMSYLINKGTPTDTLFIDEALMSHPGQVFFAIGICSPSVVKCMGDVCQIPFVNRTPAFDAVHTSLTAIVPVSEVLYKSYRCPPDVCRRLNDHYVKENKRSGFNLGMHSAKRNVENTCLVTRISNNKFPIEKHTQYLTFTQAEKQILKSKGLKVSTVHEFQGKEAKRIIVVRLNDKKMSDIYLRFNYALVAITRHTVSMHYYTRYDGDALSKLIGVDGVRTLCKHTDEEILEVCEKFGTADLSISKDVAIGSVQSLSYVRSNPGCLDVVPVRRDHGSYVEGNSVFLVARNGSSDDMSLRMIRSSIDKLRLDGFSPDRVCLRNSFLKYFSPEVLSFTFRRLASKVYVLSDEHPEDVPYQIFQFANKNGITQDFSEEVETLFVPETLSTIQPKSQVLKFNLSLAQEFLDDVFGDTNYLNRDLDAWLVNTGTLEINIGNISFDTLSSRVLPVRSVNAKPVLQTTLGKLREYSLREYLLAIEKRNRNVPLISGTVDIMSTAHKMWYNMMGRVIDPDLFFPRLKNITVSTYSITKWMNKQDVSVLDKIVPEFSLHDSAVNSYNFSIKRRAKPVLTCDAHDTYAALQTIVYHEKHINAAFCSIFSQIGDLIIGSLLPNVILYTGMSTTDFQTRVSDIMKDIYDFEELEVDISKYDKSQGAVALEFECFMMHVCGVEDYWIDLWRHAHMLTRIYDRRTKIDFVVPYQRKSGDASTFIGNTVFLMAVICDLIPIEKMYFACFSGDDSLIFGHGLKKYENTTHFALKFNLDVKFFRMDDSYYFCSKFLVKVNGLYYFVPDPLKLFVKFGRDDLVDRQHLEEYRISLEDNCKAYAIAGVPEAVAKAVSARYGVMDYSLLFRMIPDVLSSEESFSQLFSDVVEKSGNVKRQFD